MSGNPPRASTALTILRTSFRVTARQSCVLLLLPNQSGLNNQRRVVPTTVRHTNLNLGQQNQPYLCTKIMRWGRSHCMHYLMVTACIVSGSLHAICLIWGGSPYIIPKGTCTSYVARKRYHVCLLISNQHTVKVRGVSNVFFMLHWFQFLAWSFHSLDL